MTNDESNKPPSDDESNKPPSDSEVGNPPSTPVAASMKIEAIPKPRVIASGRRVILRDFTRLVKGSPSPEASNPETLPRTAKADSVAAELRNKLVAMMDAGSLARAHRRRANVVDSTDLEATFDDLVHPAGKPKSLVIVGDVSGYIGGIFTGVAVKTITASPFEPYPFWISAIGGILLFAISLFLKHAKLS